MHVSRCGVIHLYNGLQHINLHVATPLYLLESFSMTFTANGKHEFVPYDQVFHLLIASC